MALPQFGPLPNYFIISMVSKYTGARMNILDEFSDPIVEYIKSSSDFCHTDELSAIFEIDIDITLAILSVLKRDGLVECYNDSRWWAI